jgi:hypothetical protein
VTGPEDDPVGSVGDETAKLLGALADWAKDQSTAWAGQIDAHIDTGAAECQYCPICRTVHVLRETSPEVRDQLVTAAASFLQAAAGILGTIGSTSEGTDRASNVQHIDLDAEDDSWPEESRP